jgi:hypothetical protein
VIKLQAGGACYSWRLPPPRRLGGVISVEACKKLVQCSREVICERHCAHPREPRRATLVERDVKGDEWSDYVKC